MDNTKKRSFDTIELIDDDNSLDSKGNEGKKAACLEAVVKTEPSLSSSNECLPNSTPSEADLNKEIGKADQRREANKLRARSIRLMKKKMLENTNKKLVLLTIENNKLRAENQMQRAEISLLRNQSALSAQHPSMASNLVGSLSGGNDTNVLQNLLHAVNSRGNAGLLNPYASYPALPTPSFNLGDIHSNHSRSSGDNIDLSHLAPNPNAQNGTNIASELADASSLQTMADFSSNVNGSQVLRTDKDVQDSKKSQINEILLSLLQKKQQS